MLLEIMAAGIGTVVLGANVLIYFYFKKMREDLRETFKELKEEAAKDKPSMKKESKKRDDDEGKGSYQLHTIDGKKYWYRHYRSKVTGKVVCVREDPPPSYAIEKTGPEEQSPMD